MELFLVRHGETGGNVAHRHQSTATPLTDRGRQQIEATAAVLKKLEPTHLVASPVLRAVESAQIIGETLELTPDTNELLRELDRPTFLHGNMLKSVGSLWFYTRWYFGLTNHVKYGGESYKDLRERVDKAKQALLQYPPDAKVVVVSHSVFINFFLAHMCNSRRMGPFAAVMRIIKVFRIKNASITRVVYDDQLPSQKCAWQLRS